MLVDKFRARLDTLRSLDASFQTFGAHKHQYRLGPVLEPAEIAQFERSFGFRLPEDLRFFLEEVGNGGAGPGYGLNRLGLLPIPPKPETIAGDSATVYQGGTVRYPIEYCRNAFPYFYFETIEELADSPERLAQVNSLQSSVWEPGDEEWDCHLQGALTLADYGCGLTARLLVNGPSVGTIWVFDDCDRTAITPFAEFAPTLGGPEVEGAFTFERWYDHWLASNHA